jgi:hypothetical protein
MAIQDDAAAGMTSVYGFGASWFAKVCDVLRMVTGAYRTMPFNGEIAKDEPVAEIDFHRACVHSDAPRSPCGQRLLDALTACIEARRAPERDRSPGATRSDWSRKGKLFQSRRRQKVRFGNRLIAIPKARAAALISLNTRQRRTGCKTRQTSRPQECSVRSWAPFEI